MIFSLTYDIDEIGGPAAVKTVGVWHGVPGSILGGTNLVSNFSHLILARLFGSAPELS